MNRPFAYAAAALALCIVGLPGAALAKEEPVSFSEDIRPVLQIRCLECHQKGGPGTEASGLDMSSYEGLMKGTKYGPMVVPGDPDTSNLMRMIDHKVDKSIHMPHGKKKLSSCDIDMFRRWIKQGAKNN